MDLSGGWWNVRSQQLQMIFVRWIDPTDNIYLRLVLYPRVLLRRLTIRQSRMLLPQSLLGEKAGCSTSYTKPSTSSRFPEHPPESLPLAHLGPLVVPPTAPSKPKGAKTLSSLARRERATTAVSVLPDLLLGHSERFRAQQRIPITEVFLWKACVVVVVEMRVATSARAWLTDVTGAELRWEHCAWG